MKKLLLISLIALCINNLQAQMQQGKFFIGGSTNLNATFLKYKSDDNGQTSTSNMSKIDFGLSGGYFIANNIALGLFNSLTYSKTDYSKATMISIGPVGRIYFGNSHVRPILSGSFGYTFEKQNETYSGVGSYDSKFSGANFSLSGGAAFIFSESVSLDIMAGYSGTYLKQSNSNYKINTNNLAISLGFSIFL